MKSVKRLYADFRPERYELYLEPNREKAVFSGRVKIIGQKTGKPSRRLTLHQNNLKITSASLVKIDKKTGVQAVTLSRQNLINSFDELRLHCQDILYPGQYVIEIEFTGKITAPMHGIYPCNFELDGKKKQLIATQFESHHAREVFPCIDEPEAKAVFCLTLKTPANETVISNTPPLREKKDKLSKITIFEDTPKMSTYLLAFVYGELSYKEATAKNGVTVRTYSTPDKKHMLDFGLDSAARSLEFFEEYFGVKYPLSKLDLVGLPDFAAGAMENWGLITFRESVFFVDPKSTSIDTKQYVSLVIAHEIAHQWFGNLVTMKWWNDLWLNESFANLMEYRATDELFPQWRIWDEFTVRETGSALVRDSLPNVQAVRIDVHHPDELSSVFDPSIVYAKGSVLINMVLNLAGESAFRQGLKTYFEEFKYSNTEAGDLWRHIGKASEFDIESMMKNWMEKPGYPLIDISYEPGSNEASLEQERLVIGKSQQGDNTTWNVPLSPSWQTETPVLSKKRGALIVTTGSKLPLTLNRGGSSYFIANYTNPKHFDQVLKAAGNRDLSTVDTILLAQGYWLMERAAKVSTTDNLELLKALSSSRDHAVWSILASIIGGTRMLINRDDIADKKLDGFISPMAGGLVSDLGWDGSKTDTAQKLKLRATAVSLAIGSKDQSAIKEALGRFSKMSVPSDINPDIRSAVYFAAVRHGTDADFNKLLKLYKQVPNADEKDEIAGELTASREPKRVNQLLKMLLAGQVRQQDIPTWFVWLMRNRYAQDTTWQWLKENWKWVESNFGSDKSYDRFPRYSAMTFSYPEQLKDYKKFFEPKINIALERAIKLGIEEIEGRIIWRSKNEQTVKDWLNQAR